MDERIESKYFLHIDVLSSKLKGCESLDFQLDEMQYFRITSGQGYFDLSPITGEG